MMLTRWFLESKIAMYFAQHPQESVGVLALAERLGARPADVTKVVDRMVEVGVLTAEPYPEKTLFSLNAEHPSVQGTVRKLSVDRWRTVLRDQLLLVRGVERAVVYWRESEQDQSSPLPIGLLVLGDVNGAALETAVRNAENDLKQPIRLLQMLRAVHETRLKRGDSTLRDIYAGPHESIVDVD